MLYNSRADIDTEALFVIRFYRDQYHSNITGVAENTRGSEAGSKDEVKNR